MWVSKRFYCCKLPASHDWKVERILWSRRCLWSSANRLLKSFRLFTPWVHYRQALCLWSRQWIKINDIYSSWSEILFGVPQGSILGPLLFTIFVCDIFMFLPKNGVANYVDHNTPYSTGKGNHNIISDWKQISDILSNWFQDNYLKINPDKYHVLLSETSETQINRQKCTIC